MADCPKDRSGRGTITSARGRILQDETGAAFFAVILLTALLLSLGIFGTRTGQIELAIAGNDLQAKRALQVAEAGLSHAFTLIGDRDGAGLNEASDGFDDELGSSGTGGALVSLGGIEVVDGDSYRFAHFGGPASSDGYYVHAIDNEDETNGLNDPSSDSDFRIRLISRGRVGGAERIVEALIDRDHAFRCVLCANVNVPVQTDDTLMNATTTDSFNSDLGSYDPLAPGLNGHVQSNGDVTLTGVTVNGNLTTSGTAVQNATNVTGTTVQFAPAVRYPPVSPCGPPFPPNQGLSGGIYNRALGTLSDAGINTAIDLGPGDYCFSSINLTGAGSSLRVTGPTRIFLTSPSRLQGVNNTTNVASNLRVYSSFQSPVPPLLPSPGVTVGGAGQVAMTIYAPDAQVDLIGITTFIGGAVGGFLPSVGLNRMTYDESLERPGLRVIAMRELRNYVPD